ncbi:HCNGP-like protein-domain-containing protein [Xylariomycetidae sp. FL2044]|nr:HCNGP-like protein-domain-containing protein [Xylariomycetidae sp. FL2044]
MAGLVSYESSDEEEQEVQPVAAATKPLKQTKEGDEDTNTKPIPTAATKPVAVPANKDVKEPAIIGPQRGPAPGPSFPPLEEDNSTLEEPADATTPSQPPGSPYTSTRATLRDLTLPTVPNMDIPPSPPGSPPPATSRKFEQFLELKKKGVHFNAKLAQSSSLRNPALMDKLLGFVDIDQQRDQYRTTLGADLWDPAGAFPRFAFKEQLRQSQSEVGQARARGKGAPVEFVSATSAVEGNVGGDGGDGQGAVAQKSNTGKRKTRFDT